MLLRRWILPRWWRISATTTAMYEIRDHNQAPGTELWQTLELAGSRSPSIFSTGAVICSGNDSSLGGCDGISFLLRSPTERGLLWRPSSCDVWPPSGGH
ncbi:hypothetical protein TIFTF001_025204 [Ficus carica]|uniref:Uncharacterized protein n=1 Tax=Ficus carica TaxID=3494 RepID=A0AA88AND7_FICCA|nr:hypothetical protein TIFTF001_025204 [Ficus carica]